MNHVVDMRSQ